MNKIIQENEQVNEQIPQNLSYILHQQSPSYNSNFASQEIDNNIESSSDEEDDYQDQINRKLIFTGLILITLLSLSSVLTHLTNNLIISNIQKLPPLQALNQVSQCYGIVGWYQLGTFMSSVTSIFILFVILSELVKKRKIFIIKWIRAFRKVVLLSGMCILIFVVMAKIEELIMGCYCVYNKYLWMLFAMYAMLMGIQYWVKNHKEYLQQNQEHTSI